MFVHVVGAIGVTAGSADFSPRGIGAQIRAEYADLAALKRELVANGHRVRLEKRQKNVKALLARVTEEGFTAFANVRAGMRRADELEVRPLA